MPKPPEVDNGVGTAHFQSWGPVKEGSGYHREDGPAIVYRADSPQIYAVIEWHQQGRCVQVIEPRRSWSLIEPIIVWKEG